MRPGTSISGRERARGSRSTHQISAPSPLNMPALRRTPANALATFPTDSIAPTAPLAGPRLVCRSAAEAALAFSPTDGVVRVAAFNPTTGEQRFDTKISGAAERAFDPSLVLFGDGYLAAYASTGPAGAQVTLVRLDGEGRVLASSTRAAAGSLGVSLIAALPTPHLAVLRASGVDLYAVDTAAATTLARRLG